MAEPYRGPRLLLTVLFLGLAVFNVLERDWVPAAIFALCAGGQWLPLGWRGWTGVLRASLIAALLALVGLMLRDLLT